MYVYIGKEDNYCIVFFFFEAKFEVAYDIGFAYPPGQEYANGRDMSFKDILYGRSIKAFLYMRQYLIGLRTTCNLYCKFFCCRKFQMQDLPSSIEDLQRFCHKLYVHKASISYYKYKGRGHC